MFVSKNKKLSFCNMVFFPLLCSGYLEIRSEGPNASCFPYPIEVGGVTCGVSLIHFTGILGKDVYSVVLIARFYSPENRRTKRI